MNVNQKHLLTLVEFEAKTYYTAFSIEFESVATVMWEVYRSIVKMVRYDSGIIYCQENLSQNILIII